ncbi:MAG: tRNA lysidine(34) synthetase TilS [Candidatus Riflebacteria bacterium]|nr:tRNA lysidine(34) synthetase TilS [Candidatus Riflebacteria bacterium]
MKQKPFTQRLLAKLTPVSACKKVAIAVSGGCDSVAMLLLLREWCRIKRIEFCVFHVDHSMRTTSSGDAEWVSRLAHSLDIEFYSKTATKADHLQNTNLGKEGWARHFRYSAFAEMMKFSGADVIATGHNADDQVETVLMRLMRGCSWQGLHGIRAETKLNFGGEVLRLWRPVLRLSRAELEKLLKQSDIKWREDETNSTDLYLRNKLRHTLIPAMEQIQPGSAAHIASLGADAYDVQRYLTRNAARFLKKYRDGAVLIVNRCPAAVLRREIIRQWLADNALTNCLSRALIDRIDDLWKTHISNKTVCHRHFKVVWSKKRLCLVKNEEVGRGGVGSELD